jgi:hypothetical protein
MVHPLNSASTTSPALAAAEYLNNAGGGQQVANTQKNSPEWVSNMAEMLAAQQKSTQVAWWWIPALIGVGYIWGSSTRGATDYQDGLRQGFRDGYNAGQSDKKARKPE